MSIKHASLIGKTFGRWTALERLPRVKKSEKIKYKCRCVCGTIKPVETPALTSGRSKSCGCLRIEAVTKRPFESLYNKLLRRAEKANLKVELSYKQFVRFCRIKTCHYCKAPLSWCKTNLQKRSGGYNLDRKDSSSGYSSKNCVACCYLCNQTKSNRFTYEEFMLLAPILQGIQRKRSKC